MKKVQDFDKNMEIDKTEKLEIDYFDVKDKTMFALYGSDALDEEGFNRLTKSQRDLIGSVSDGMEWFSRQSSGIQVKFITDASEIFVKIKLTGKFNMTNMTQIGQCGTDLYVYDNTQKSFVLHGVAAGQFGDEEYDQRIGNFTQLPKLKRRFILNLPLYTGVESCYIGVNKGAYVKPDVFSNKTRIAVYGTSITQGCSASRPGMAYTNILSRHFDCEVLNFGFSGVAMMELEMAKILNQIPFDVLVIDTEANAGINQTLKDNVTDFIDIILQNKPKVPILLLSRIKFAMDLFDEERIQLNKSYIKFMRFLAINLRRRGVNLYFYNQSQIFGKDFTEYTIDGIHPTDLGMERIANCYENIIIKTHSEIKQREQRELKGKQN